MTDEDFLHIGNREIWGEQHPFGLHAADRRQHLYCIGKSGTGKTTLLRNCILQDIYAGHGVAVLDPHGDLAETLIDSIPRSRTDHVVYLDPADIDHPIGLNLLEQVREDSRHLLASELVSIIRAIWPEHIGPRMEYILYAAAAALAECQNVSLLALPRMLVDEPYRRWILKQVNDPIVKSFWMSEFAQYDKRFVTEAISPIQNKIGQLLMTPHIRNILGQVRSKVSPRFIMDNQRILIANLSKGRLGEDKARLLGAVLVSKFQVAALSRAEISEAARTPFYLYIDEAHNFCTDSFLSILSEARKFGLCLTLAHQYLDQLGPKLQHALFGNIGSIIAFRVGFKDAMTLTEEFGQAFGRELSQMENFQVVAKLLANGKQLETFAARTSEPFDFTHHRMEAVKHRSRQRFSRPRAQVESRITKWMRNHLG